MRYCKDLCVLKVFMSRFQDLCASVMGYAPLEEFMRLYWSLCAGSKKRSIRNWMERLYYAGIGVSVGSA